MLKFVYNKGPFVPFLIDPPYIVQSDVSLSSTIIGQRFLGYFSLHQCLKPFISLVLSLSCTSFLTFIWSLYKKAVWNSAKLYGKLVQESCTKKAENKTVCNTFDKKNLWLINIKTVWFLKFCKTVTNQTPYLSILPT